MQAAQCVGHGHDRGAAFHGQIGHPDRQLPDQQRRGAAGASLAQKRVAVRALSGQRHEQLAGPDLPRINRSSPDEPIGRVDQATAGCGSDFVGGQGERPRSRPRLRLAGVGHLSSFAQGRAPDLGRPAHPRGEDVGATLRAALGGGPEAAGADPDGVGVALLRGGIPRLATASVATRRKSW